ncbi:hypothetical protein EWB00_004350 [Schistosoma japonicum]|uniref:G-protein coupled receptors family 1 profile domain-containing protein n=1 Tax=Schistosoma japonicum TaxID=6182 RepID=A0A4Z2D5X4_SCHJA|nr:hypothetical protein EWB00_004350 [Schistosoma japonicum]
MCDTQYGIINSMQTLDSAADKIDVVALGFSFTSICLNPILVIYLFDINLGSQFLGILLMLQMTFEWFASITAMFYVFCPSINTDQLWLRLIVCHMWSSTFMYNLFIMFSKYNSMSMLIERCFQLFYPNKSILDYPRTVFASYCFAMIYITAINLRFTVIVQLNENGQCIAVGQNSTDEFHQKQLLVFGYLCLVLLLILPAIVIITCYMLMFIRYIKIKRSNKNFSGFNSSNLQHILTLLIIIWSAETTSANILDMVVFYNFQNYGYTSTSQTYFSVTELIRIIYFSSRTLSLFLCVQPIREKFTSQLAFITSSCLRICKRR